MIAFSCPSCAMKFQLKDEFAGRSTKCPTCKHALTVPVPDVAKPAPVHVGNVANDRNQQIQAAAGGVTLALNQKGANDSPDPRSVSEVLNRQATNGERYIVESEIARGGMGAVL